MTGMKSTATKRQELNSPTLLSKALSVCMSVNLESIPRIVHFVTAFLYFQYLKISHSRSKDDKFTEERNALVKIAEKGYRRNKKDANLACLKNVNFTQISIT
jgi:hypothetical protein